MSKTLRKVAILGGTRTPFVKSFTSYKHITNQDLLTAVLGKLVANHKLEGQLIDEVALGAVIKHSADFNLARESVLGTSLDPSTPAYDLQRACGTGLEAATQAGLKIAAGQAECAIAGGTDTNSDAPVVFSRRFGWKLIDARAARSTGEKLSKLLSVKPSDLVPVVPQVREPRTGLSMGEHCEKMVQEWRISREDQDQLALASHQAAARAYAAGFYADILFPFNGIEKDAFVRGDTSLDKLAKLKPAFDFTGVGTLTAGNSTPLTDGAAVTLLGSEDWAAKRGLTPLAYLIDSQAAAVDFVHGEGLLMAPTIAVSRLLERNGLTLQDFDFYEIHEAFAGQVLCTLKAWESDEYCQRRLKRDKALGPIDRTKMNVNGGSLALGHPFAATGSRCLTSLAKTLSHAGRGRGLISICTAGGMGVASIVER
jgi:acetyl-CoA C-acetyltransferase